VEAIEKSYQKEKKSKISTGCISLVKGRHKS